LLNQQDLITSGISPKAAAAKAATFSACAAQLLTLDRQAPIESLFVPGRIEVLGKHTDYCGGRSLICAVERGLCVCYAPRTDQSIHINDLCSDQQAALSFGEGAAAADGWTNYPMTVVRRLVRNFGKSLLGADIVFSSDLPPAAGMSSSSALIVAIFLALSNVNQLHQHPIFQQEIQSAEALAGYLGTIENGQSFGALTGDRGVGTFGGSQDHTAILCAKPRTISQYRFAPVQLERQIAFPSDFVFVVGSSGVKAEKTAAAREKYNRISRRAGIIVQIWNAHSRRNDPTLAAALRSGPSAEAQIRALLHDADRRNAEMALLDRLEQFVRESEQIIPLAGDAIANGDLHALGPLVEESHQRADKLLKNQVDQTNFLAQSARDQGAVAASAFGAGFGGSVWSMVREADAEAFGERWGRDYYAKFPGMRDQSAFFITRPGPGVISPAGNQR
jgi:galactokinase